METKGKSQIEIKMKRDEGAGVLDNTIVILNPKEEMKGSTITGSFAKECAELLPRITSNSSSVIATKSWVK